MIGSIYAIITGPTTLSPIQDAMTLSTFNIFWFIVGCIIIYGLEKIKIILEKKNINS